VGIGDGKKGMGEIVCRAGLPTGLLQVFCTLSKKKKKKKKNFNLIKIKKIFFKNKKKKKKKTKNFKLIKMNKMFLEKY